MAYILRESTGFCLQDAYRKIYKTKSPEKRIEELFYGLLKEIDLADSEIDEIRKEIKEYGECEGDRYSFIGDEAYVDFDDVYRTRTFLHIVA